MALPHGGIGGLNIDIIDAQNSGLDLFSRPEIDASLLQGNDVLVSRKAIYLKTSSFDHFYQLSKVTMKHDG